MEQAVFATFIFKNCFPPPFGRREPVSFSGINESVVLIQFYYNPLVNFQADSHRAGLHSCTSRKYVVSCGEPAGDLPLHYPYSGDWQPGTNKWDNGLPAARDQKN